MWKGGSPERVSLCAVPREGCNLYAFSNFTSCLRTSMLKPGVGEIETGKVLPGMPMALCSPQQCRKTNKNLKTYTQRLQFW